MVGHRCTDYLRLEKKMKRKVDLGLDGTQVEKYLWGGLKICLLSLLFLVVLAFEGTQLPCCAQDLLLGSEQASRHYILVISGRVNKEKFHGAKGLLTLSPPAPLSLNVYQLIIEGFPKRNSRNSFYWNSEDTFMTAFSNEILCDLKRVYTGFPDIHFFYLSPALLERRIMSTHREGERKKLAEKTALPTKVFASGGRLRVTMNADEISGTVMMKGYDNIERAFVDYVAGFHGKMTVPLESSKELKK